MAIHPETWEIIRVTSKRAIKTQFLEDSIMKNTCIVWTHWVICPPTVCLVKVVNHTSPILFKSISTFFNFIWFQETSPKKIFPYKNINIIFPAWAQPGDLAFRDETDGSGESSSLRMERSPWPGRPRWWKVVRMDGFYTPKNQRLERRSTNPSTQTRIFSCQLLVFQGAYLQWEGKTH